MRFNLSEINELIRERRTIYPEQFSDRKVHKEQLEVILNNAQWAPTHGNTQPWRFKVFSEDARQSLGDFLAKTYLSLTPKDQQNDLKLAKLLNRPKMASSVIAVCMERQAEERILEIEEIEAVACAIQNMYLTCTAYGLGGFWSTPKLIYTQEMNDFLKLGEKDKCLGLFYIGYPNIEWPKGHRKPLEYTTEWKTQ
ncbi:MAG: nitroreductase [Crocinitomicaceae bacterium]|nr:nitroreductase [Crocinitomicaceae bacterium]MDG1777431.1 nitroreductase [Crocinitomicaceae bacterium]